MMSIRAVFTALAASLAAALAAPASRAVELPVVINPMISISSANVLVDYQPGVFATFTVLSLDPASGSGFGGDPTDLQVLFLGEDPSNTPLSVLYPMTMTPILTGDVVEAVFADSETLEILFGAIGGTAAPDFGSRVLASFTGMFGANPLVSGFSDQASSLTIHPVTQVIPVPAALPLLTGAFLSLWAMARRRRS